MSVSFYKIYFSFCAIVFLVSCYNYDDYNVNNIVSSYNNQQVIRKSAITGAIDGYYNYKNDSNSVEQRLIDSKYNQHIYIYVLDCNEKLHPISWSNDGSSFILHFYNSNYYKLTPKGERLYVFRVENGVIKNIHQVLDKKIIETFFLGNTFNYITSENTDTIKIDL